MPNRILKESICTSDTIEKLTPLDETFFYRLMVNCDDYGRMDARPAILKARLYPLKERLSLSDVRGALGRLADAGCVKLYKVDGKPYLYLPTWGVHQSIRAKKSKFPSPESGIQIDENICNQMQSDDCKCPRNPIQSESNPNPNTNTQSAADKPPKSQKHKYGEYKNVLLTDADIEKLKEKFPGDWEKRIDVLSKGIELKGYKYKNHFLAICKWAENDKEKTNSCSASYDLDMFEKESIEMPLVYRRNE